MTDLQQAPPALIHNRINRFLATPVYIAAVSLLTALSNLFGLELPAYTIFCAITVYVCLFGQDLLPLMPLMVCCYLAPSVGNNPGHREDTLFSVAGGGVYILCLAGVIVISLLYRVIRDRKQFLTRKYVLLPGIFALCGSYLLSGIGSEAYPGSLPRNLLFAFLQCVSVAVPYLLFCGGINWQKVRKDYFAWIGFATGCILLLELTGIYLTRNVVVDGIIVRKAIFTGWGMHNNIGGMLAFSIPFAFYLATKYRKGWLGTVVGSAFLLGAIATCSRSSILCGSLGFFFCVLLMLYYARNRRHNAIALVTIVGVLIFSIVLFHRPLLRLFSGILRMGTDPSSRDTIYLEGLKLFAKAPIFGNSFFSPGYQPWDWSTVEGFSSFFPPRWHNTVIQLLASCGAVGLLCYGLHRAQTIKLFLSSYCKEKSFIACFLLVFILTNLFDCHFYNLGPTLFYSMALAFAESCPHKK